MTIQGRLEEARQRLHMGEKTFKPTPNTRNPAMLQYKGLLTKYDSALGGFLVCLPVVGKVNLPRAWEAVEGTTICEPVRFEMSQANPYMVGGDYDEELLQDTIDIMRARVDAIIRPIDRWLESLAVVKARMKKLETLRLDVDARRRWGHGQFMKSFRRMTASDESGSMEGGMGGINGSMSYEDMFSAYIVRRQRRRAGREDQDFEREREEEDFARDALNQHRQLEAVTDSFNDQEEMVFEQLSKLCRDAAFFKSYAVASLVVFKDTVQSILLALGKAKRPLPGFHEQEPADSEEHVSDLVDLTEALPKAAAIEGGQVRVPNKGRALSTRLRSPGSFRPRSRLTAREALASEVGGELNGGSMTHSALSGQEPASVIPPKSNFEALQAEAGA
ncbi:hypothetical protein DUNSADRAFT_15792 [Dunaliella salina]|uniref:Uncharacterized protein n=1 Tax=Dunaliella salina TaxID=3046 RepID=A0ABQ7H1F4_DUNSA|nr:hypothetical protein DUNSADRAFT_15792 [Dunaliella salina]|eukprot:KAF5840697.1 hypothetical protein DUNSADRAFT_15792 [Dunaliella salina]